MARIVAAAPAVAWIANVPGNAADLGAHAVAARVDASGNTYVTGSRYAHHAQQFLTDGDFVTIKYGPQGTELWRAVANGLANDEDTPSGIALGSDGRACATGSSRNNNGMDFLTVCYSSGGTELWRAQPAGAWGDMSSANAIHVDAGSNVVVVGTATPPGGGATAGRVIKYDDGGTEAWRVNVAGWTFVGVTVDASGMIYVSGVSYAPGLPVSASLLTLKFSPSGVEQWRATTLAASGEFSTVHGIAVLANGNVIRSDQGLTLAYGPSGNELWRAGLSGALAVDSAGNAYIAGGSGNPSRITTTKLSITGAPLWQAVEPGTAFFETAFAVAVDAAGNPLVVGYKDSPFGMSIIKYDGAGHRQWEQVLSGAKAGNDAIGLDSAGNPVIAATTVHSDGVNADYLTVKYDPSGVEQWRRSEGPMTSTATLSSSGKAVAVDARGNTFVAGTSTDATGTLAYLTVKLDSTGREAWRAVGPPGVFGSAVFGDAALAIALDSGGNALVTGTSSTLKYSPAGSELWRRPVSGIAIAAAVSGDAIVTGGGSAGFLTVRYAPDGTELWRATAHVTGNLADTPSAIALGPDGRVTVAGATTTFRDVNPYNDFLVVQYDANGVERWRRLAGTSVVVGGATAVRADAAGNTYVTGTGPTAEYQTIKYSPDGTELWRRNGAGGYRPTSLAVDSAGGVVVTGVAFDPPPSALAKSLTIKYDAAGVERWRALGESSFVGGQYVAAIDPADNVYVAGYDGLDLRTLAGDLRTVKYSAADGLELWRIDRGRPAAANAGPALALGPDGSVFVAGGYAGNTEPTSIGVLKIVDEADAVSVPTLQGWTLLLLTLLIVAASRGHRDRV